MKRSVNRSGRLIAVVSSLLAIVLFAPAVQAEDDPWEFKWSNGFKLESPDGKFKLKFGGRLQADWSIASAEESLETALGEPVEDGNEFRRARLFFEGTIYENVEFKVQYDFAGGDADFKDAYFGIRNTPIGNLKFGHFKEPFSFEELTSSKYITFLERSLPNAFAPGRNMGIMVYDQAGERIIWAVGLFRESNNYGTTDEGDGKLNITARIAGTPIYEDEGRKLLHVGLAVSQKDLGADDFSFSTEPEAHQSPDFVDTGDFAAEEFNIYGAEIAFVMNRFWAAAEHTVAEGDAPALGDPCFNGTYVQAGFFLTDDHRRYKKSSGTFDRMKPSRNFGEEGSGAVELAVRYSTLDLTDGGVTGGELDDLTFAVNWYLNPATRLMFNYVDAERDDIPDGEADFFLLRFQVDF